MYETDFFCGTQNFSLPAAGLFSRSRLRGTQGVRPYTTAQVWVPTGLRGACSGRSKSRNLASNAGLLSDQPETNQAHANPQAAIYFSFFPLYLPLFLKYHSSRQTQGTNCTTAALQAFPFVTATSGASARVCVSVRVCACHCRILQEQESDGTRLSQEEGATQLFLLLFLFCGMLYAAAVCLYHTVSF